MWYLVFTEKLLMFSRAVAGWPSTTAVYYCEEIRMHIFDSKQRVFIGAVRLCWAIQRSALISS